MPSLIKVLVVDDSALIRQILTRALSVDPRVEVVGVARDGVEAIQKARELDPDVITLDINMPELNGLEALPHILKDSSARVLILSNVDDPETTYQALDAGAVDFISKPKQGFASSIEELSDILLKKIHTAYGVDPRRVARLARRVGDAVQRETATAVLEPAMPTPAAGEPKSSRGRVRSAVAIASSTGGPPALERVFDGIPESVPASFLVVQHLPPGFSASLARRLNARSSLIVREAEDGMPLVNGTALIAPHGRHMRVADVAGVPRVVLSEDEPVHGMRPSADPLFESVADVFGEDAVGVVLTGMGSDGAQGLARIKESGGRTIAQDEETSVVWGMPSAAVKAGAVGHIVPVGLVAAEIRRSMRRS